MRAHYLQHVAFEGLGSILPWLKTNGYQITKTEFYNNQTLPDVCDIDLLIIMGGPMSVNEERKYPYLIAEKRFIKQVIDAKKSVLGICLGAQLIASSMGAEVMPNMVTEIGWFPIQASPTKYKNIFRFPSQTIAFHWHGETFNLPEGATQIATNKVCANQAFQIGSSVIGLQFHLEITKELAQAIVKNCRGELVAGKYIQQQAEILSVREEQYQAANCVLDNILTYLN